MMRIALITDTFLPKIDGIVTTICHVLDHPDVVHIFNPVSLGFAGLRQAKKLGIPVVASYHTDLPGFLRRWRLPFC